ncbi:MAG: hypothetical protein LLG01_17225 [Planctomycetaceae bacterium]|nr:hypothetical protein [Planctomycetaceae bacterium]
MPADPKAPASLDWYPVERRVHPSVEETVGLCAYRLDAMAVQIEQINKRLDEGAQLHADITVILADLKEIVANKRAINVHLKFLAWVGGTIITLAAAWHAWKDIVGEAMRRQ